MRRTKLDLDKFHWATFPKLAAVAILLTGYFSTRSMAQQPGQKTFSSAEEASNALATAGIQNVSRQLEHVFGEPVTAAIRKQARTLQDLREKSSLRVATAGLLTSAPAVGIPVRPNTFHGKG